MGVEEIGICAMLQKAFNDAGVVVLCGEMQRGPSVVVLRVNGSPSVQGCKKFLLVAVQSGIVQRYAPVFINTRSRNPLWLLPSHTYSA